MKIISFAWTTDALLAGAKTMTRRNWSDSFARSFKAGEVVAAYDRSPRIHGKQVATIRLTAAPYRQRTSRMKDDDFQAEGLGWMCLNHRLIQGKDPESFFSDWLEADETVWVVPFELVSLEASHDRP